MQLIIEDWLTNTRWLLTKEIKYAETIKKEYIQYANIEAETYYIYVVNHWINDTITEFEKMMKYL